MRSARALPQNHPRLRPVSERRLISGGGNLEIIQPRQCASQCFRRRVPQIEAELEVSFGFHEMQPNRARYSPRCSKVRRRTDSLRVVRQSSSRSGKGTVGEYPFASTKPRLGLRPIRPAGFFAFPKRRPGFARVTMESAILNYFVGQAHPLVIEQHIDARGSNSVMGRTAIGFVAAIELSTVIL